MTDTPAAAGTLVERLRNAAILGLDNRPVFGTRHASLLHEAADALAGRPSRWPGPFDSPSTEYERGWNDAWNALEKP